MEKKRGVRLSDDQRRVLKNINTSSSGVQTIAAHACTGKTLLSGFLLEALVPHIAWAAPPRRVVGYCCDAERLRAALPDGYWLERATPFELTPPADCPYVSEAAGDRCFVVVIGFDATGVYEPGA